MSIMQSPLRGILETGAQSGNIRVWNSKVLLRVFMLFLKKKRRRVPLSYGSPEKTAFLACLGTTSIMAAVGGFIAGPVLFIVAAMGGYGESDALGMFMGIVLPVIIEIIAFVLGFLSRDSKCGAVGVCVSVVTLVVWMLYSAHALLIG